MNGTVIAGPSQEEEEVDVEEDSTEVYGPPQYVCTLTLSTRMGAKGDINPSYTHPSYTHGGTQRYNICTLTLRKRSGDTGR